MVLRFSVRIQTILCSISESPLHVISLLVVYKYMYRDFTLEAIPKIVLDLLQKYRSGTKTKSCFHLLVNTILRKELFEISKTKKISLNSKS